MANRINPSTSLLDQDPEIQADISLNPSSPRVIEMTHEYFWRPPPDPAGPTHNYSHTETHTRYPSYSIDPDALYTMINEQALYPPAYYVQVHGTHRETEQTGSKESEREITDFYFRINITHLLGSCGSGKLEILPNTKRGYRGTRYPSLKPSLNDLESRDALFVWCEKYVSDSSKIKSFSLTRKIRNHDTQKLYQLIKSAILETQYQGRFYITFPATHCKVIVYSPNRINKWRTTLWIRWFFYLSFLWILAWPILIFLTCRYEVVSSVFYYADSPNSKDLNRKTNVKSEVEWFLSWKNSIKNAVLTGINIGESALTDEYRIEINKKKNVEDDNNIVPYANAASNNLGRVTNLSSKCNLIDWGSDC